MVSHLLPGISNSYAHQKANHDFLLGCQFTQAANLDFPTTVELPKERGEEEEKRERTSETLASGSYTHHRQTDRHRTRTGKQAVFIFPDQVSGQHLCAGLTPDLWK